MTGNEVNYRSVGCTLFAVFARPSCLRYPGVAQCRSGHTLDHNYLCSMGSAAWRSAVVSNDADVACNVDVDNILRYVPCPVKLTVLVPTAKLLSETLFCPTAPRRLFQYSLTRADAITDSEPKRTTSKENAKQRSGLSCHRGPWGCTVYWRITASEDELCSFHLLRKFDSGVYVTNWTA